MIDLDMFVREHWKKPMRLAFSRCLVVAGRLAGTWGFLENYPNRPVFVLGSPRSGTSMFSEMLSRHPQIANFSEALQVWEPKDRDLQIDHLKTRSDVTARDANRITYAFGLYQKIKNRPVFVNKCPRSSVRIEFIHEIFPQAKFIHIVRDGRAVVNSMINIIDKEDFRKKKPLGGFCKPPNWKALTKLPPVERHAYQWVEIMEEIIERQQIVSDNSWFDLKYEDLCANPSQQVEEVFEFIGLPVSEQFVRSVSAMPHSVNWKWRGRFEPQEIEKMNSIMGGILDHYSYEVDI